VGEDEKLQQLSVQMELITGYACSASLKFAQEGPSPEFQAFMRPPFNKYLYTKGSRTWPYTCPSGRAGFPSGKARGGMDSNSCIH
jgi:hypothetical protein